ncbi:hypothetical protein ACFYOV_11475 [Streptomyces sp. NPDC005931]|uniref:hypothetical protein n=1 Tax=Streptomyces sp. NPDC005931 TaxID=3364737 RepID=UPI0036A2174B
MYRTAALAAASAVVLALTPVLTACSSDDSDAKPESAPSSPSSPPVRQMSPAERIATIMIGPADVEGFSVDEPNQDFVFAKSVEEVEVDRPVCAPLAHAMNQLPLGDPQSDLTRALTEEAEGLNGAHTYVTLTVYEVGGAQSALADVRKAVDSCRTGFTAKASGGTSAYDSVNEEKVAPAGDEALGFKATMTFRGASHTLHTQVVRDGDVLGVYFSVNGLAIARATPSDARLPAAVVKAQNEKLG